MLNVLEIATFSSVKAGCIIKQHNPLHRIVLLEYECGSCFTLLCCTAKYYYEDNE